MAIRTHKSAPDNSHIINIIDIVNKTGGSRIYFDNAGQIKTLHNEN